MGFNLSAKKSFLKPNRSFVETIKKNTSFFCYFYRKQISNPLTPDNLFVIQFK